MQRLNRRIPANRFRPQLTGLAIVLFTAGCSGTVDSSEQAPAAKPRQGTTLRVSCPDDRLRTLIEPMVRVWAHETGAAATVTADRMTPGDATDVAILPNAELGLWADRGELVQVPFQFREPGNAYVWSGVLQPYRNESAAGWGGQLFGLRAQRACVVFIGNAAGASTGMNSIVSASITRPPLRTARIAKRASR